MISNALIMHFKPSWHSLAPICCRWSWGSNMKCIAAGCALAVFSFVEARAEPPTEADWHAVESATMGRSCRDYVPPPEQPTGAPYSLIPEDAVSQGISGWAFVYFEVEQDGAVSNARILASDPDGLFDAAAIAAATGFKFVERASRCEGLSVLIEFERTQSPTGIVEYVMSIKRPVVPVSPEAIVAQISAPTCDPAPELDQGVNFIDSLARHYPRSSLDATGWVSVRFDVEPGGSVANVAVIDSEPTDIFDAAALGVMGDLKFRNRESACAAQVTIVRFVPQVVPRE